MATYGSHFEDTFKAGADLSAEQYKLVKVTASNTVEVAGAGELAIGVLQDKPVADQGGNVTVIGLTKVVAGGTIAAGAKVAANATGQAVVAAAGNEVLGIAQEAGVANDVIEILFNQQGILPS